MKDFLKNHIHEHFDKLLLSSIFMGLVVLTLHLIHRAHTDVTGGAEFVNWAETQAGTVLGALLTLITGFGKKLLAPDPAITQTATVTQTEITSTGDKK